MIRITSIILGTIGIALLAVSFHPMYLMLREVQIGKFIGERYTVEHADRKEQFPAILQTSEITVNKHHIQITEEQTGRYAPLTHWDILEQVPPGEIVTIQIELNGIKIAAPTEMWLSNRSRGGRYFSWLDVLTVQDHERDTTQIAIVQRITADNEPMDDRQWRIIYVHEDGSWEQKTFGYLERSEHPLDVKLVNYSYTNLMSMGFRSDILTGYPNLFFPLLYPWVTTALGFVLTFASLFSAYRRSRKLRL